MNVKRNSVFYWLNQITKNKKEDLSDIDLNPSLMDDFKKGFNRYLILKFLSMNPYLIPILEKFNMYNMKEYDDVSLYKLLLKVVPVDKTFYKYIKAKKDDNLKFDVDKFESIFADISVKKNESILKLMEKSIDEYLKECEGGE